MALIYIVEDDKNIREIETFALKNSGFQIRDFDCASQFYAKMEEVSSKEYVRIDKEDIGHCNVYDI